MKSIKSLNICIQALNDLKAQNLLTLDISESSNFSDWFVIATATSDRHAKAIANNVVEVLKNNNVEIIGVEGKEESEWILIDSGEVVINIMLDEIRSLYDLESLWGAEMSSSISSDEI